MPKDENNKTAGKLIWPPEKTFKYELELGEKPLEILYETKEKEAEKGRE